MKIIEITISPQGEVTLQTKGYTGSTCKSASQALEEALGIKATEKLTSEFYQAQSTPAREELRQ